MNLKELILLIIIHFEKYKITYDISQQEKFNVGNY